ncbi:MAG: hypothetical protein AAGA42_12140 [Actinomycetota bacterium]
MIVTLVNTMEVRAPALLIAAALATSCATSSAPDADPTSSPITAQIVEPPRTTTSAAPTDPGLELRADVAGDPSAYDIATRGSFAVWWDPAFPETAATVPVLLALLAEVEADAQCLGFGELGTAEAGQYLNVYVHHPGDDRFPDFLGNGLGYSDEGIPYLAMPFGAHDDPNNVRHEAYHALQSSSEYAVVDDDLDAQWIIEASAEWYQQVWSDGDPRAFVTAGSVYATPQYSLWHLPESGRPDDPIDNDWLYGVRQYGAGTFLYYLTEVAGVDRSAVAGVYTANADVSAQEFLYDATGGERLGAAFADWAAGTAVGFDYLTDEQATIAMDELAAFAGPDEIRPHVLTLSDPISESFSPSPEDAPRAWGYNSIVIENISATTYSIRLDGDPTGSAGGASRLVARVAIKDAAGDVQYLEVPMSTATTGELTVAAADDTEIYVIVAAVPATFGGTEGYDYELTVAAL